jgi:hypothetical protein
MLILKGNTMTLTFDLDIFQRISLKLLFLKGDPKILGYYRPTSLSNTDYKILAFT